jgi:hypothetical protein
LATYQRGVAARGGDVRVGLAGEEAAACQAVAGSRSRAGCGRVAGSGQVDGEGDLPIRAAGVHLEDLHVGPAAGAVDGFVHGPAFGIAHQQHQAIGAEGHAGQGFELAAAPGEIIVGRRAGQDAVQRHGVQGRGDRTAREQETHGVGERLGGDGLVDIGISGRVAGLAGR